MPTYEELLMGCLRGDSTEGNDGYKALLTIPLYENPPFYLTAYGLAVRAGFKGTLEEWLASLKGEPGDYAEISYDRAKEMLCWKLSSESEWRDLLPLADLQGPIVAKTLAAAEAARSGAETAQAAAENAAVRQPTISDNDTWMVWDIDVGAFVDTGISAVGPQGPVGPRGYTGKKGADGKDGTSITINVLYEEPSHILQIMENGVLKEEFPVQDGLTPYIGKDGYWYVGATSTAVQAQGPTGSAGADGKDGADGVSPKVEVEPIAGGHRVTITDAHGSVSFDVLNGKDSVGGDGTVGGSPTLDIQSEAVDDGIKVIMTVTPPEGLATTHVFTVPRGSEGVGIESVEETFSLEDGGDNTITFRLSDGTKQSVHVRNGSKGSPGADGANGYTPVKGKDYYTDADKQEMVTAVLAALPVGEEARF